MMTKQQRSIINKRYYETHKIQVMQRITYQRNKLKDTLIEFLGGKCSICGYRKCRAALEFHHLDPNEKEFCIAHKRSMVHFEKVLAEAKKCRLLCANCHREIECIL